jgi:hypothetical protein
MYQALDGCVAHYTDLMKMKPQLLHWKLENTRAKQVINVLYMLEAPRKELGIKYGSAIYIY